MYFYKIKYTLNPNVVLHKKTSGTDIMGELIEAFKSQKPGERVICAEQKYNVLVLIVSSAEEIGEESIQDISMHIQSQLELKSLSTTFDATTVNEALSFDSLSQEDRAYLNTFVTSSDQTPSVPENPTSEPTPSQPSATKQKTESIFSTIEQRIGMEDLKRWAKEMKALSEKNVPKDLLRRALMHMSYLVSINPGCGCTTMLESVGSVIAHMLGYSGCTLREYYLEPDSNSKNSNLEELCKTFKYPSAKNPELTLFAIHIDKLQNNQHFFAWRTLLDSIWDTRENAIFAFVVPYLEPSALFSMRDTIEDVLPCTILTSKPLSTGDYTLFFAQYFEKLSMSVTDDAYVQFSKKLAEEKSDGKFHGIHTVHKICDEILFNKIKTGVLEDKDTFRTVSGADVEAVMHPIAQLENEVSGFDQLDSLISLHNIKKTIREIIATIRLQKRSDSAQRNALHMMFSGAPGTGKTVVARILGRILREEKILTVGGFYEVSRKDLVGLYIGHTGPKTAEVCQAAYGSVLFIDEAYTLNGGDEKDFGSEAIGTLIAEMENKRDNLVVIFAGYEKELEKLFDLNPGLRDRIPYKLKFENYSREELAEIFTYMIPAHIKYDEDFIRAVHELFANLPDEVLQSPNFSNARFVRNLVERVYSKAALRLQMEEDEFTQISFTKADLMQATSDINYQKLNEKKAAVKIGF